VGDRPTERRFGRGPFDVDVDPLVVAGGICEQFDAVLGDGGSFGGAQVVADHGEQGGGFGDDGHHDLLAMAVL